MNLDGCGGKGPGGFFGLIVVAQSVPFDNQRGSRALSFFTFENAIAICALPRDRDYVMMH
jgi:hypothetical protein